MMVNHITLEHSDDELRRFWDLETLGITPCKETSLTTEDSRILQEFSDSYCIEDGRRVVHLPKKNNCELSPNRDTAERRFRTLQKRLQQDDQDVDRDLSTHIQPSERLKALSTRTNNGNQTAQPMQGTWYVPSHCTNAKRIATQRAPEPLIYI